MVIVVVVEKKKRHVQVLLRRILNLGIQQNNNLVLVYRWGYWCCLTKNDDDENEDTMSTRVKKFKIKRRKQNRSSSLTKYTINIAVEESIDFGCCYYCCLVQNCRNSFVINQIKSKLSKIIHIYFSQFFRSLSSTFKSSLFASVQCDAVWCGVMADVNSRTEILGLNCNL